MSETALSFASGHDSLSVRHFSVHEALSALFEITVVGVSPLDDIDFEPIVGHGARFTIHGGALGRSRGWDGICSHFEQQRAEETGLSTYVVRVVPHLWLATQRRDHRIFQHHSVPEIVRDVLAHWKIHPVLALDAARYPAHPYRVQHAETDFAFISRLLEEAGITYRFSWHPEKGTELVLSDEPHRREPRHHEPIHFAAERPAHAHHPSFGPPESGPRPFITNVTAARAIRPGAFTIRDFDFRRRLDYELAGKAHHAHGVEARLEQYHYSPGAFEVEKAGHGHHAHADEKEGTALAERSLEAERALAEVLSFEASGVDLAPGAVFSIGGHPRARIAAPHRLLALSRSIEGSHGAETTVTGRAAPASAPHRPAKVTPRPRVHGVESAIVVGPEGEAIHTDEHGRVRVKFHWDRGHKHEHEGRSSCWIRVSQGWAGSGFGTIAIPRVGQEVLVGFFEGDPDQPVIVGRVYNAQNRAPYALPEHATRSAWRSATTPGGEDAGYNEIMFEDARGAELVSIHAARDLHKVVKESEIERTGGDRTIAVGRDRTTTVGGVDSTIAGARHAVSIGSQGGATGIEITDRRIHCTTGEASITFDGANLSLEAQGNVTIVAHDGDVVIKGGPNVKINSD